MAKNKVDITGINTNDIKVLKSKEMIELFKKFQSGDTQAREELIYGNLKLVLKILRSFQNKTDNMDDLFQIGCVGLVKAIDNFDLGHEVKFSTYAVPMILGEIKRYIRDNNGVRISRSIKENAYKILRYKDEFIIENSREPRTDEIANYFDLSEYDVVNALMCLNEPISISEPIFNDGGDTIFLEDQIADKKDKNNKEELISMRKALMQLKKRERDILIQRYLVGKTQMELAKFFDISQAQVSRLEKNAIKTMRRMVN